MMSMRLFGAWMGMREYPLALILLMMYWSRIASAEREKTFLMGVMIRVTGLSISPSVPWMMLTSSGIRRSSVWPIYLCRVKSVFSSTRLYPTKWSSPTSKSSNLPTGQEIGDMRYMMHDTYGTEHAATLRE